MARNDGVDRTFARNRDLRLDKKATPQSAYAHNERQKESYSNPDIIPERTPMNVHFKSPAGTYEETFDALEKAGVISTWGMKPNSTKLCELIFDVNSAYFYNHGGYEFAKQFYADAYQAAIKIVGGEQYIVSAVMHADERNRGMSEQLGEDVYHYHMHVVYVPVVDKEVRWTKRCKDKSLVGTVKEVKHQVSRTKKWDSKQAVDENGQPMFDAKGKKVIRPSYSVLQDDFYNFMRNAGYTDVQRGERGSTEEHLTVTQFKVEQEQKRHAALQAENVEIEMTLLGLEEKKVDAENELQDLSQQAEEVQGRLDRLTPKLKNVEAFVQESIHSTDELLPEAGTFESGKRYREDKAVPAVSKLRKLLLALYQKYLSLKQDFQDLWRRCTSAERSRDYYKQQTETLSAENRELSKSAQDLARVRCALGDAEVDTAIEWAKDREMTEALAASASRDTPVRPPKKRSNRDAR